MGIAIIAIVLCCLGYALNLRFHDRICYQPEYSTGNVIVCLSPWSHNTWNYCTDLNNGNPPICGNSTAPSYNSLSCQSLSPYCKVPPIQLGTQNTINETRNQSNTICLFGSCSSD